MEFLNDGSVFGKTAAEERVRLLLLKHRFLQVRGDSSQTQTFSPFILVGMAALSRKC